MATWPFTDGSLEHSHSWPEAWLGFGLLTRHLACKRFPKGWVNWTGLREFFRVRVDRPQDLCTATKSSLTFLGWQDQPEFAWPFIQLVELAGSTRAHSVVHSRGTTSFPVRGKVKALSSRTLALAVCVMDTAHSNSSKGAAATTHTLSVWSGQPLRGELGSRSKLWVWDFAILQTLPYLISCEFD